MPNVGMGVLIRNALRDLAEAERKEMPDQEQPVHRSILDDTAEIARNLKRIEQEKQLEMQAKQLPEEKVAGQFMPLDQLKTLQDAIDDNLATEQQKLIKAQQEMQAAAATAKRRFRA